MNGQRNNTTACFLFYISKLTKIDFGSCTNQTHTHSGYYFSSLLSFFSFFTSFYQYASKVCDLVCLLICRESAKVMANKLQNWVTGNYRKATVGVNVICKYEHCKNVHAKIKILSTLCLNCAKIVKTRENCTLAVCGPFNILSFCQCGVYLTFWIKQITKSNWGMSQCDMYIYEQCKNVHAKIQICPHCV